MGNLLKESEGKAMSRQANGDHLRELIHVLCLGARPWVVTPLSGEGGGRERQGRGQVWLSVQAGSVEVMSLGRQLCS